MNFPASKDTLLRAVRKTAVGHLDGEKTRVRILGVDDFAFRKGQTYGTILVDLEQRKPIDLLPDREAETLKRWLVEHPEIEVVSRDRAPAYADGTRRGAPQAKQVADRFHLLKNAREALETFLGRKYQLLKQSHQTIKARYAGEEVVSESDKNQVESAAVETSPAQNHRVERFNQVKELREKHYPIAVIARTLKMHRRTVRLFLCSSEAPVRKTPLRRRSLSPFIPFLERRWSEGERNATKLWGELKNEGFRGCQSVVVHFVKNWREPVPAEAQIKKTKPGNGISRQPPTPRQTGWFLFDSDFCRRKWQSDYTDELCRTNEEINVAKELVSEFHQIMKTKKAEELSAWLKAARSSGIAEFTSFAKGIENDRRAVEAAIETSWSNGQVEGQVNKLKTIKRAMYGRAKFDLLRAKVLFAN